ncbi:MAG: hypothetical protein H8D34_13500 [Chloroflexi bacterium]|nr:hypothetical protein [Chloroflexota bacterium]
MALINLRAKLYLTPAWFNGTLERNHNLLLAYQYTNNEQSRLLQFYIPEAFRFIFGMSIPNAYILQRWLFVFLALIGFHFFQRKWFDTKTSFAGVLFLASIMPLSYYNHLQESAPFLLLSFLLVLWAIREQHTIGYVLLLFVGAFNNETILSLPFVYFCYNFRRFEIKHTLNLSLRTIATCLPAYIAAGVIRYINRARPHLGGAWHFPDNIEGFLGNIQFTPLEYWKAEYLYIIFIFGVLWIFAMLNYSKKPLFLQRAVLLIPIFLVIHFLTGIIKEVRQLLPLSFIIIPMAFFYIFPSDVKTANELNQSS